VLYGTTDSGGTGDQGTVFKLNKDGSGYRVLHHFEEGNLDGSSPHSALVERSNGEFFGTAYGGGASGLGVVFQISSDGATYSILRSFSGSNGDGSRPDASLIMDRDGAFYGTTAGGGDFGFGTVFKLFSSRETFLTQIQLRESSTLLSLSGGPGMTLQIQALSDLSAASGWQIIGAGTTAIDGSFQFLDTNAANYPIRFYRGVTP
jgi:uncharacterized repeat protein (TIGR03803 family)